MISPNGRLPNLDKLLLAVLTVAAGMMVLRRINGLSLAWSNFRPFRVVTIN